MDTRRQLQRRQGATFAALLLGYSGYYVCRSNLSVVLPALIADPSAHVDRVTLGLVASAGILAYAIAVTVSRLSLPTGRSQWFASRSTVPSRRGPARAAAAGEPPTDTDYRIERRIKGSHYL